MNRSFADPASTLSSSMYAARCSGGVPPNATSPSAASVTDAPSGIAGRSSKSASPPSEVAHVVEPGATSRTSYCSAGTSRYLVTLPYEMPVEPPAPASTGPVKSVVPCGARQKSTLGAFGERWATRTCAVPSLLLLAAQPNAVSEIASRWRIDIPKPPEQYFAGCSELDAAILETA